MLERCEWALPETFRELKSLKDVRQTWADLTMTVENMNGSQAEESGSILMQVALGHVKSLLPWVETLWYSVRSMIGVGVSGCGDAEAFAADGYKHVKLVAMETGVWNAVEAKRGVEHAVLEAFCRQVLRGQVERLATLLEAREKVERLLNNKRSGAFPKVFAGWLSASKLLMGASVVEAMPRAGASFNRVLDLFEGASDLEVLWEIRVVEELGAEAVEWSVLMEEDGALSLGMKKRDELEGDLEEVELEALFLKLEEKRERWRRQELLC